MINKRLPLIIGSLLMFSSVASAEGCVPSFIKVDNKYRIETKQRELIVKVKKIDATSCWIKVKEVLSADVEVLYQPEKKEMFWFNMANISVIRKKL